MFFAMLMMGFPAEQCGGGCGLCLFAESRAHRPVVSGGGEPQCHSDGLQVERANVRAAALLNECFWSCKS